MECILGRPHTTFDDLRGLKHHVMGGKFCSMRRRHIIALCLAGFLCAGISRAQLIGVKQYNGKTITCMHSGLSSDLKDCGVKAWWYTYVFIGRIMSIAPAPGGEKTLEIDPVEIFHGDLQGPLTVTTSQVGCLPPLSVGARWLFYLRKEKGKPIVMDYYGNDSLPVAEAQERIKTLRRLQVIGNRGIVRGMVRRGDYISGSPVADATVVARGGPGDERYFASTNKDGNYEFPPLPAGSYKVGLEPIGGFEPASTDLDVSRSSCWDLALERYPHGRVSGYVRYSDGRPVKGARVILVGPGSSGYIVTGVDTTGLFQFDHVKAGKYVVGVRLPGGSARKSTNSNSFLPPASLYYPDTQHRSDAEVINMRTDDKVGNINFTISAR